MIKDYYLRTQLSEVLKSASSKDGNGLENEFGEWLKNPLEVLSSSKDDNGLDASLKNG